MWLGQSLDSYWDTLLFVWHEARLFPSDPELKKKKFLFLRACRRIELILIQDSICLKRKGIAVHVLRYNGYTTFFP